MDDESIAMFKASIKADDPGIRDSENEPVEVAEQEYGGMDLAYDLSLGLAALAGSTRGRSEIAESFALLLPN